MKRFPVSETVFAALLLAYPRRFRNAFGVELRLFFRDDRARAGHRGGAAVAAMWLRTIGDLAGSAWRQRLGGAGRARDGAPPPTNAPWKANRMSDLLQDARFGIRSLARDRGFAVVAILTLALGVGATTAVFSVIDGVLLRPLPYPQADRLVYVGTYFRFGDDLSVVSQGNIVDLTEQATTLESVVGSGNVTFTMLGNGAPELIDGARVGIDFFRMFGGEPVLGRDFAPPDFEVGASPVAVLEHDFWRERWGGDPAAIGSTMRLDGEPHAIIGVAPAAFVPPEAAFGQADARLWVPLRIPPTPERTGYGYQALARLAPGATLAAASEEIDRIFRSETEAHDLEWEVGGGAVMLRERTLGGADQPLLLLLLGVGFLLLIACANVANLMLARGTRRGRELAVRRSLGAGRGRLVRQLLTESIVLALAGGACGALLSYWAVRAFLAASPGGIPRLAEVGVDLRVLLVSLAMSTAVGLLFGLAPALQAFGFDASSALRSAAGAERGASAGNRLTGALVVAETALALILLIGAALLVNSFVHLHGVDAGFDGDDLVAMRVDLRSAYPDRDAWGPLFRGLLDNVRAVPGIESASLTTSLPFAGIGVMSQVLPLDTGDAAAEAEFIASTYVSRGHFRNMGMRLLEGDDFEPRADGAPLEVIVNDAMLRQYWPAATSALGRRIRIGTDDDDPVATVIGTVNALRYRHDEEQPPEMYFDMESRAWRSVWVIARTSADVGTVAGPLREALWEIDADLPVDRVATVEELAWSSLGRPRFYSALAVGLACVALLLALVGLYGTLAYAVGGRVREIGVRMALGARPGSVVALVLRGGLVLALLGIGIGGAGAWGLARLLERYLFGVEPTDPPTFAAAAGLFVITALMASWIPARRAARLDPFAALRSDP